MSRSAPAIFAWTPRPLVCRLAALALLAGAAAGCSANLASLTEPIFTGSTPNQKAIISGHAAAYPSQDAANSGAGSGETVARQDLPPASAAVPAGTVATAGSAPSGATTQTPQTYAARGMPQPLGRLAAAPTAPQQPGAAPAAPPQAGGAYVVKPGDSLWSIAQAHSVSTSDLLAANGLTTPTITPGQTLAIPGSGGPRPTQVASLDPGAGAAMVDAPAALPERRPTAAAAPQPQAQGAPQPAAQSPAAAEPVIAYAPATRPDEPTASAADGNAVGGFRWPVRGRIIASFGKKPNGERHDGIKLAVPEGTSVRAAESGTVIYAGDELKSYGNLILIRHADGWVSAYAHNRDLLVRRGDEVRRGQIIAHSGMTGNVTTPQVHFELRKGATPVDPVPHMSDA